jgi:hypothetical protein
MVANNQFLLARGALRNAARVTPAGNARTTRPMDHIADHGAGAPARVVSSVPSVNALSA